MMQNITFSFPENTQTARDFFSCLKTILSEAPHILLNDGSMTLSVLKPKSAHPSTNFRSDKHSNFPTVRFDFNEKLARLIGPIQPGLATSASAVDSGVEKHDKLGVYYELSVKGEAFGRLPIAEIQKRLQGHVVCVDHTGLNIPAERLTRKDWDDLIDTAASNCNIYKYPTGDDWPFILPATTKEFKTDITTFPVGRGPKFELVYDTFWPAPTFQIDLETDLDRQEVERLFPAPYGVSSPDLADYFRTVYVQHEWAGLSIRFDIRFRSTDPLNDWDTGKWLVESGGRIAPRAS